MSILAGGSNSGNVVGPASIARFNPPDDIFLNQDGSILVCDTGNSMLKYIAPGVNVSLVSSSGVRSVSNCVGAFTVQLAS
jgi:hypothetical protein